MLVLCGVGGLGREEVLFWGGWGGWGTYVGSSDGNDTALIAGLNNRRVDAGDGVGEGVEIRGYQLVQREILPQDIEELH